MIEQDQQYTAPSAKSKDRTALEGLGLFCYDSADYRWHALDTKEVQNLCYTANIVLHATSRASCRNCEHHIPQSIAQDQDLQLNFLCGDMRSVHLD